jgi:hypothetical protein
MFAVLLPHFGIRYSAWRVDVAFKSLHRHQVHQSNPLGLRYASVVPGRGNRNPADSSAVV